MLILKLHATISFCSFHSIIIIDVDIKDRKKRIGDEIETMNDKNYTFFCLATPPLNVKRKRRKKIKGMEWNVRVLYCCCCWRRNLNWISKQTRKYEWMKIKWKYEMFWDNQGLMLDYFEAFLYSKWTHNFRS